MEETTQDVDLAISLQAWYGVQANIWMAVATHTLFVYDLILTSQEEYRYVWKASWSIGKLLYILVRYPYNLVLLSLALYPNLATNSKITIAFCKGSFYWEDFGWWVQLAIVKAIVGLRTVALYEWKLGIVILVGCLGSVSAVTILAIDFITANRSAYSTFALGLLPMMVFEFTLFLLTLYKYNSYTGFRAPLLQIFYRDGLVYFAAIFCCVLVVFVIFNTAQLALLSVTVPLIRSIVGIMCGRFILKLRGALLQPPEHLLTTNQNRSYVRTSGSLGTWRAPTNPLVPSHAGSRDKASSKWNNGQDCDTLEHHSP